MTADPLIPYMPVALPIGPDGKAPRVHHRKQTHAEKQATKLGTFSSLRAIFTDPIIYRVAHALPGKTEKGGRPAEYPDWVYMGMIAAISSLGSKSATVAELRDPDVWRWVCSWAAQTATEHELGITGLDKHTLTQLKARNLGPTRSQYHYFQRCRLTPEALAIVEEFATSLYVQRLNQMHLADPNTPHQFGHLTRSRCLVVDGKVTNSPKRTLATTRVNKETGEILPVREDDARGRYGEGGKSHMVYGSKWGTVVIADTLTNLRITVGTEYMPHGEGHSEAKTFLNMLRNHVPRFNGGIDAVLIDGAVQGVTINTIQKELGILVIAPPRRASRRKSVALPHKPSEKYEAAVLPRDAKHPSHKWACGGPVLIAGAGTVWTEQRLDNGELHHTPVKRGQIKRQTYTTADGAQRYTFSIELTITNCPECGQTHKWWESLTTKASEETSTIDENGETVDHKAKGEAFNRTQYLRAYTPVDPDEWKRVYGMRGDVESNNSRIEVAWYGQRIPAWGKHNQSIVMFGWTLYSAAKAKTTYLKYLNDQAPPIAA